MPGRAAKLYPAYLDLRNIPVLIVGGGAVAARKATGLKDSGAGVTVVAPNFHRNFKKLCAKTKPRGSERLRLIRRKFKFSDLRNKGLVFAATDDSELNRRVARLCRERGVLVNAATDPEAGNFQAPATVRRNRFCVAISTGGASAKLAQAWRKRLEKLIGPEWGRLAELLEAKRRRLLKSGASPARRRRILAALGSLKFALLLKRRGIRAVERAMDRFIDD